MTDPHEQPVERCWTDAVKDLLRDWSLQYDQNEPLDVIASPDLDGVLSILLLQKYFGCFNRVVRVIGIYTTIELYLCDGADGSAARRALWVDHDMLQNLRSIGNHLSRFASGNETAQSLTRHPLSFNLNDWFGQGYHDSFRGVQAPQRDKCPFGTATILAHALMADDLNTLMQQKPYHSLFAYFAHADSLWLCSHSYTPSTQLWYQTAFDSAPWLRYVVEPRLYSSDATRLRQHEKLVNALCKQLHGSFQRGSSASSDDAQQCERRLLQANANCIDPQRWSAMRGKQGLSPNYFLTMEQRTLGWLDAFRKMFMLVGASFSEECLGSLLLPQTITSEAKGQLHEVDPSQWKHDAQHFAALMCSEGAQSVAITNRSTVRYTNHLPLT